MATPSLRRGASRIASNTSIRSSIASSAPTRQFTTSLVLRAKRKDTHAPNIGSDSSAIATTLSTRRSNPLVGNIAQARQPEPPQTSPQTSTPTSASTQSKPSKKQPRDALLDLDAPPPPPPPPATLKESAAANQSESAATEHPYNAAGPSSAPLSFDIASIIASKSASYGHSLGLGDPLKRPKVRAKAVSGRTVHVKDRVSPTSGNSPVTALRVLDRMVREQKVKNKFHSQRFHERKGLKRKRLASVRWRSRFKIGFKAAVSRVLELRKQGW